jgi:hypothetical protein
LEARDVPIPTTVEETIIRPNWLRAAACLGLIAVVPFGLWMTLIGLATSSGLYEKLEPVEQAAGGRIAVVSLFGAVAAIFPSGDSHSGAVGGRRWGVRRRRGRCCRSCGR